MNLQVIANHYHYSQNYVRYFISRTMRKMKGSWGAYGMTRFWDTMKEDVAIP